MITVEKPTLNWKLWYIDIHVQQSNEWTYSCHSQIVGKKLIEHPICDGKLILCNKYKRSTCM